ncbi:hypothetical protein BSP239C_00682 [Brevibacterium sp. 239c]|uniref:hypothetical protein n=1 Tax=Brevibacterium sp. 239c TaxID=1965356 RepID=UPI000C3A7DC5|nr:hypothetical protein [Brevibacterium sp. 239c]SMX72835.1 hypothetical protein BSP239C_00682 [Brevibacterium sp. 239c]
MEGLQTVAHVMSQLLLPISQKNSAQAVERAQYWLGATDLEEETARADYLRFEITKWRDGARASVLLRNVVTDSLLVEKVLGEQFPGKYFLVHEKLQDSGNLSFEDASALLSHSNLIAQLLIDERLSCAQVAGVLSARRGGFEYNWNQLQIIAAALGVRPVLSEEQMFRQSELDVAASQEKFGDATPEECIGLISEVAASLGYSGDLSAHLVRFFPGREEFVPQYSVILNTNLLIVEEYDHPVSAAYEFAPRSGTAKRLQRKRHPSYTAVESAYLNNSKGASFFDRNWAWSRMTTGRSQALALADIFSGLNQMAYPARRELASWIRPWLMRIEDSYTEHLTEVYDPDLEGIRNFFSGLSVGNSHTFGILEQRAVDFLATAMLISSEYDFEVRGRGDSVSASNTSKLKMGDVEFKSRDSKSVIAFEAHGGSLSDFYVNIHADSLAKILKKRKVELEQLGNSGDWNIEVRFVAHDITEMYSLGLPSNISGYTVAWSFTTFNQSWNDVLENVSDDLISTLFKQYVRDPVAGRWVSDGNKAKFNQLIDGGVSS